MMANQFVRVYRAASATEAHLLKGLLEQHGVRVRVLGDGLASAVGELPADVVQVDVEVPPGFVQLARELIEEYEQGARGPINVGNWICPDCQEHNPYSFDFCWHCRRFRTG